jgi:hypothetical protein
MPGQAKTPKRWPVPASLPPAPPSPTTERRKPLSVLMLLEDQLISKSQDDRDGIFGFSELIESC